MDLGSILQKALDAEGRSQKWLSGELSVSPSVVNRWCQRKDLRTSTIRKIHRVLYVPEFAALLGEEDEIEIDGIRLPRQVVQAVEDSDDDWFAEVLALIRTWRESPPGRRGHLLSLLREVRKLADESSSR